jgi:regulator of RNase E activity RraA
LQELEKFDSCTISNAIEQFDVRTRNEGFVHSSIRCIFPEIPPKVGFAATARIRTSSTPIAGRCYYDRPDWWSYLVSIPAPRFIVAEDVDRVPGLGAFFGEIHATISVALGCVAYLTNGSVRDLPGIRRSGFQVFAANVAVSHAYAHVIEFGEPVEIGGLHIRPGDLLHGDQHGVISVPVSIAAQLPTVASELEKSEAELIDFCRSPEFSFEELPAKMRQLSAKVHTPEKKPK